MNRSLMAHLGAGMLLASLALSMAQGQSTSPSCNNKLIGGNYGFSIQGTKLGGLGPTGQQVGVAMTEFDGNGNLTQIDTVTVAGQYRFRLDPYGCNRNILGQLRLHGYVHRQLHRWAPAKGGRHFVPLKGTATTVENQAIALKFRVLSIRLTSKHLKVIQKIGSHAGEPGNPDGVQ